MHTVSFSPETQVILLLYKFLWHKNSLFLSYHPECQVQKESYHWGNSALAVLGEEQVSYSLRPVWFCSP